MWTSKSFCESKQKNVKKKQKNKKNKNKKKQEKVNNELKKLLDEKHHKTFKLS